MFHEMIRVKREDLVMAGESLPPPPRISVALLNEAQIPHSSDDGICEQLIQKEARGGRDQCKVLS